ncbi:MAG: tRNA (adenosine(37)-N6)-threonylcarbamoyltransferase complex ATPase subunit type 1 TsaE [Selenomonadaceae bacterium]|nr:tRNA (adenosine(37)-N6)-threonylcarbamoyltransferase complex ATPase subunit type 1 TsaE [Selenomonadaceae bacterium]
MFTCITESPEQTSDLAVAVGKRIREGTVLCLEGDLGAGKTLFVQALAATLGVESEVTSPTFNLMNIYEGICPILHFDLYRLESEEQLEDIGFFEYTEDPEGIVVIEWADKFPDALPEEYVTVRLERTENPDERCVLFSCIGERNEEFLKELEESCQS